MSTQQSTQHAARFINSGDVRPQSRGDRYPVTVIAFGDDTYAAVNLHQDDYAEKALRWGTYAEAAICADLLYHGVLARTVRRLGGTFHTWDQLVARVQGARLAA